MITREERDTGASDESLRSVIEHLQRADALVRAGRSDDAGAFLDIARRLVADSWSFRSDVAAKVLEVEP
ncbi:hypothetical protein [Georgenia faecalis]|uniref:hypothetical protein n=1 Tax=Georgenia faecalis TaxID=2483799 RepID=UPI000FD70B63|nr:hypothetical protein [Georgenia faecalis]